MNNNNLNSALFELQKNLEDLSSAKKQVDLFREKNLEITNAISDVQNKYIEHLEDIKLDYKNRINDLKNELSIFASANQAENEKNVQLFLNNTENTIKLGITKIEVLADKIESSKDTLKGEISNIILKSSEHLDNIKSNHKNHINELKNDLSLFATNNQKENATNIQLFLLEAEDKINESVKKIQDVTQYLEDSYKLLNIELVKLVTLSNQENQQSIRLVMTNSEEPIIKGVEKFEAVSQKIESTNFEKIEKIKKLLEHYKNVVEASNSLINKLTAIDFPSKLDALSAKSQLTIESINGLKQALEIKLNESKEIFVDKYAQLNQNIDSKVNIFSERLEKTNSDFNNNITNINEQNKILFGNLRDTLEAHFTKTHERLNNQEKSINSLKTLVFSTLLLIILDIIAIIFVNMFFS